MSEARHPLSMFGPVIAGYFGRSVLAALVHRDDLTVYSRSTDRFEQAQT
jgi:hypothetical protein